MVLSNFHRKYHIDDWFQYAPMVSVFGLEVLFALIKADLVEKCKMKIKCDKCGKIVEYTYEL